MGVYSLNGAEQDFAFSKDGNALFGTYDIDGIYTPFYDPAEEFLDTAIITALSSVSESGNKQGACTDGEYIYQTAGDATNYTYMNIIKYKIADGTYTVTRFNGTPNFGHANDMTYDPNTGYLYVATMLSDGSVIVIDTADMSYVETLYLVNHLGNHYAVWQFCFDRNVSRFYSAYGSKFIVYDEDFNYLSYIEMPPHPDATGQGCETDGEYIYRVTYAPNLIDVATITGRYVKTLTLPMAGEPETILYGWDGKYYVNCNTTGQIFYTLQMKREV